MSLSFQEFKCIEDPMCSISSSLLPDEDLPIADPPLDNDMILLDVTASIPLSALSPPLISASEPTKPPPAHYHRMKMNYFRRLNVIPILSSDDVRELAEGEGVAVDSSKQSSKSSSSKSSKSKSSAFRGSRDGKKLSNELDFTPPRSSAVPIPTTRSAINDGDLSKSLKKSKHQEFLAFSKLDEHTGVFDFDDIDS